MNRFRMMACMVPVLMLGVSAAARGDDKAVGKRPILASETLGAQRYAVIIGINDYRDEQIPNLKFAEGDAQGVYDVLTDPAIGGIKKENATLLLGKSATTRNIRKALAELRTIPKDATVFIFFSGHGAKESGDAFWVTYDSELGGLAFSAMPDREIRALTDRIPSSRLIMLLDCCYAAATVKEQKSVVDLEDVLKKFVGKGRVTITASGSGEEAIEAKDLKRGVFTYYLLEALRGAADGTGGEADGIVTVPELTAYIDKTVAEAARRRKGIQKPAIFMEEVQDPAKFLVTIDPAKMALLAGAARRQSEQVKARLGILKQLFIDEKLTVEQYRLGKDLFGRDPGALGKQDRERVAIFVDLVESKIPARRLEALLDSVESPAQRAARLERERVAAEVKKTGEQPSISETKQEAKADFDELTRDLRGAYASGKYKKALAVGLKMHEIRPKHLDTQYNIACMYCLLGKKDKAYSWLEKAIGAGYSDADQMLNDDDFKAIRGEDRFEALVKKAAGDKR